MFAVTERLLLRPGWAEDAAALSRTIGDAAIVRNLSRVPWPYALGDAEQFLALPADPSRPRFLICLRDGGGLVGGIGLHGERQAELGYWVAREQWGRGFATEAARAVMAIADASLRLPRVAACHALDNPASGRVLTKLGFRPGALDHLHSVARGGEMEVRRYERERGAVPVEGAALAA